jgi:hypothetical protein
MRAIAFLEFENRRIRVAFLRPHGGLPQGAATRHKKNAGNARVFWFRLAAYSSSMNG